MSWCALDILAAPPERSSIATWLVQRTGQSVVEHEDGSLLGVAPEEQANSLLQELRGTFGPEVRATTRSLPEQDWNRLWREGLGPRRVGRLLITLTLVAKQVLPSPLLYISAYFEATRSEYYARLLAVTEAGEWEEWLDYFFRGVTTQAEDALGRIQRIDALLEQWRGLIAGSPSRLPERALELLVENPFWTVSRLGERLGVAFTTAQRSIDRLESIGVVTRVTDAKRNRVYCARGILDILEESPRLPGARVPRGPRNRT